MEFIPCIPRGCDIADFINCLNSPYIIYLSTYILMLMLA